MSQCALAVALAGTCGGMAAAYVPDDRWTSTASGATGTTGDPVTLSWSLLRDGVSIPDEGSSNLIAYLDGQFGASSGGSNLTTRPWFHLFQESFDRWSQLGGITFAYEPNDSGALSGPSGALGTRGDIRIGGANIDGASGTLAYTYLPDNGDMVFDTGETSFFATPTNNYRSFRNTLMHELGHAFGLLHVESTTERFLMEPFIDTSIDGPQLDEVRAIQGMYGDPLEKTFGGLGNDVSARASALGSLASGGTRTIGAAARGGQDVGAAETDFVSIANAADVDFFSFTIASPLSVDFTLTPLGGVFNQAVENGPQLLFDANARNDLALAVFGPNGTTLLGSASNTIAGQIESIADLSLTTPGQYFVRVAGATDSVQLFELALSATSLVVAPTGDFDGSGTVDGHDFLMWQRSLGASGANLPADGNRDGVVNAADLALWKQSFGQSPGAMEVAGAVPEPPGATLLIVSLVGSWPPRMRRPGPRSC
jgi:serralysin